MGGEGEGGERDVLMHIPFNQTGNHFRFERIKDTKVKGKATFFKEDHVTISLIKSN